jgi:hypothetical protein
VKLTFVKVCNNFSPPVKDSLDQIFPRFLILLQAVNTLASPPLNLTTPSTALFRFKLFINLFKESEAPSCAFLILFKFSAYLFAVLIAFSFALLVRSIASAYSLVAD